MKTLNIAEAHQALDNLVLQLKLSKSPASWVALVEEFRQLDEKEEQQMFGEALPPGLKLLN